MKLLLILIFRGVVIQNDSLPMPIEMINAYKSLYYNKRLNEDELELLNCFIIRVTNANHTLAS